MATTTTGLPAVAIALDWTIAALVLYNLVSGLFRCDLPRVVSAFHIPSEITILLLRCPGSRPICRRFSAFFSLG